MYLSPQRISQWHVVAILGSCVTILIVTLPVFAAWEYQGSQCISSANCSNCISGVFVNTSCPTGFECIALQGDTNDALSKECTAGETASLVCNATGGPESSPACVMDTFDCGGGAGLCQDTGNICGACDCDGDPDGSAEFTGAVNCVQM